jgi:hypothetical protein
MRRGGKLEGKVQGEIRVKDNDKENRGPGNRH